MSKYDKFLNNKQTKSPTNSKVKTSYSSNEDLDIITDTDGLIEKVDKRHVTKDGRELLMG